jgi:hypothetical protein
MTLKLKSFEPDGEVIKAVYEVSHTGAKGAAPFTPAPVTLNIHATGAAASIDLGSFELENEDMALDALATALEAAAAGLRGRGEAKFAVPVFS